MAKSRATTSSTGSRVAFGPMINGVSRAKIAFREQPLMTGSTHPPRPTNPGSLLTGGYPQGWNPSSQAAGRKQNAGKVIPKANARGKVRPSAKG